eukprot:10136559-Alexandrium_andersonii.AAC.1
MEVDPAYRACASPPPLLPLAGPCRIRGSSLTLFRLQLRPATEAIERARTARSFQRSRSSLTRP